jgi:hypothetical protein
VALNKGDIDCIRNLLTALDYDIKCIGMPTPAPAHKLTVQFTDGGSLVIQKEIGRSLKIVSYSADFETGEIVMLCDILTVASMLRSGPGMRRAEKRAKET